MRGDVSDEILGRSIEHFDTQRKDTQQYTTNVIF